MTFTILMSVIIFVLVFAIVIASNKSSEKENERFKEMLISHGIETEILEENLLFFKNTHIIGYKKFSNFTVLIMKWHENRGKNNTVQYWGCAVFIPGEIPDLTIERKLINISFKKGIKVDDEEFNKSFSYRCKDPEWFKSVFDHGVLSEIIMRFNGLESIQTKKHFNIAVKKLNAVQMYATKKFIVIKKRGNVLSAENFNEIISFAEYLGRFLSKVYY